MLRSGAMHTATATSGRRTGAPRTGLALPVLFASLLGAPAALAHPFGAVQPDQDSTLARWRDYALASITPARFSWALPAASIEPPSVLDRYTGRSTRPSAFELNGEAPARVGISVMTGTVSDTPSVLPNRPAQWAGVPEAGLQRTMIAPSLSGHWGDHGTMRLTGVLAYQRFASLGFGTTAIGTPAVAPGWLRDTSWGAGARIDVGDALTERLGWSVGYQSRIGMGAFENYRGVYADAGSFDIPASASLQLRYALFPALDVDVGVQRVMYSTIAPFTSSNLPTRFLALLGSASSPAFRWRDLDVYSIGWTLHEERVGNLQLRYTTRQQPVPTSRLLANALAPVTANDMVSLGWVRALGAQASFGISASYATSPYYLLMPTYSQRSNAVASRFEFEAFWTARF